jgi:hypothetical protein
MGRIRVVGLGFLGTLLVAGAAAGEGGREIRGVLRDAAGKPVAQAEVVLEIGHARLALTEDSEGWESVETVRVPSGADGTFAFADVPEGASLLVWAKTPEGFASAPATPDMTLTLAPLGSVTGKVTGKPSLLKGLRVHVRGGGGLGFSTGTIDEDSGRFEVPGVTPGECLLLIQRGNFPVVRAPIQVVAGEEAKAKSVRVPDGFLHDADPLVEVTRVRLVDAGGRPVAGVQFVWSSQWGDGGMDSDAEGVVRLAGGGVAIGGPPYFLRTGTLRSGTSAFRGVLKGEKGGTATVELQPLHEVTGSVIRAGKALDLYRLHAVTNGKAPRVLWATQEKGRYSVHLPPGPCRIVVLLADGTLHESVIDVAVGDVAQTRDITLP